MQKQFYSHIIEIDTIIVKIESSNFSDAEKSSLFALVEHSLHTKILDTILAEFEKEEDKNIFLDHLVKDEHDKIWKHLGEKISGAEGKIKNAAQKLLEEFHKDLEKALF